MEDSFWTLNRWWRFNPEEFKERWREERFDFDRLPNQSVEDRVLKRMFTLLDGDSEKLALLLRFIDPANYALLSQPTRHVLALTQQHDRLKEYRVYLFYLRMLKDLY